MLWVDIADRGTDVSKAYHRGKAASKVKLHSQEMMLAQVGSVVAKFEPNSAISTLLGTGATKGDGQMSTPPATQPRTFSTASTLSRRTKSPHHPMTYSSKDANLAAPQKTSSELESPFGLHKYSEKELQQIEKFTKN